MKKYRVIVPSWGELSQEMQVETGSRYPAFIHLGGIPLYAHILRLYERIKRDCEFVFVLSCSAPELQDVHLADYDVNVIRVQRSSNIGESVSIALENTGSDQGAIIHMADTIFGAPLMNVMDTIYVQMRKDLYRWTSIEKRVTDGSVRIISDRNQKSVKREQSVCIGVFTFSDSNCFRSLLNKALGFLLDGEDPFFSAVEMYSKEYSIELLEPEYWHDCGNVDSFYESRLSFHNLRHFNYLSYDPDKGSVTKRSKNAEAFRHQVRWFKQVPDELSSFLPRIYESSDGEAPYISMELLSLPTLGELFVNSRLEIGAWNDVAQKIMYINGLLKKHQFISPINEKIAYEIYVSKTKYRIHSFIKQRPDACQMSIIWFGQRITIEEVLSTLNEYALRNDLLKPEMLAPIHGDMCFSNLMYDSRGRNLKLIDPRGEFGVPGIYGDPRYDLAKLMHSYSSGYDFIVSDRFQIDVDCSGVLHCTIEVNDYHRKVCEIFDAALFADEKSLRECCSIQALLFLSMLPLHSDKPNRQLAMLFIGLNLYAQNFFRGVGE